MSAAPLDATGKARDNEIEQHDPGNQQREAPVTRAVTVEGFALIKLVTHLRAAPEECFFWATQQGAELDLLVVRGRRRRGFEFKLTTVPTVTKSMRIATHDLRLDSLDVVHAGSHTFPLAERIRAVSFDRMLADVRP